MKKIILISSFIPALLLFSCGEEKNEYTQSLNYGTTNLVTNIETGETTVSGGIYNVFFNLTDSWAIVTSDKINANGTTLTLKSEQTPFTSYLYNRGDEEYLSSNFTITNISNIFATANGTYPIEGGSLKVTTSNYFITNPYPDITGSYYYAPAVIGEFNIDDTWLVRTFSRDSFFKGTTTTQYSFQGTDAEYSTEETLYRLTFNLETKKAQLVLYNARFAKEMPNPLVGVILKDLDVVFSADGYTVTGTNIVPLMIEGAGTTPAEDYTFSSFSLKSANNSLTSIDIEYVINFRHMMDYTGQFTGSYVWLNK